MMLPLAQEAIPLRLSDQGVAYVGGTRVTLDTVVEAFDEGLSAEEIAHQYDALSLADVYATLAWYLRHESEVHQYLAERRAAAEQIRRDYQPRSRQDGLRARLLSRRQR